MRNTQLMRVDDSFAAQIKELAKETQKTQVEITKDLAELVPLAKFLHR